MGGRADAARVWGICSFNSPGSVTVDSRSVDVQVGLGISATRSGQQQALILIKTCLNARVGSHGSNRICRLLQTNSLHPRYIIFCPLAREIGRGRVYNSRYDLPCVAEQTARSLYDVRSQRRLTTFCLSQDTTVMYDIATCVPP